MKFIWVLTCLLLPSLGLSEEPFGFGRMEDATYAVHTRYTVAGVDRFQREAYLYRLEFQKHVEESEIEADTYLLKKLNMVSDATEYSAGTTIGYGLGGQLPVLFDLYKAGNITGALSPDALFKKPLLFPVLSNLPAKLEDGVEWTTTISPIILEEDMATKIMAGDVAVSNLPPAIVRNRVLAHEILDGRACLRISSTISVQSEHGAIAQYKVDSYFGTEDRVPVLNIIEGTGHILDPENNLQSFSFYRKGAGSHLNIQH